MNYCMYECILSAYTCRKHTGVRRTVEPHFTNRISMYMYPIYMTRTTHDNDLDIILITKKTVKSIIFITVAKRFVYIINQI